MRAVQRILRITGALAVLAVVAVPSARAQAGAGGRGAAPRYDVATVETLAGTVHRVDTVAPRRGGDGGVHLLLATARERVSIHLGPAWYLADQPLRIATGDRLTIRGSRITWEGKPAIVAAEVRRDDQLLTLRDAAGLPAWRRQNAARPRRIP